MNYESPPYHETDPAAWLVYADWLQENSRPQFEWLRALRFAAGLRRLRRLGQRFVLVSDYSDDDDLADVMWNIVPVLKAGSICSNNCLVAGSFPVSLLNSPRWFTDRIADTLPFQPLSHRYNYRIEDAVSCPAEYPELIEKDEPVAYGYFMRISRGLRVCMRQGDLFLEERFGGGHKAFKRITPYWNES